MATAILKVAAGGLRYRAATAGNTTIDDPDAPNTQVTGTGGTGIRDLTPRFSFGGEDVAGGCE
jgi:hypothetical protein